VRRFNESAGHEELEAAEIQLAIAELDVGRGVGHEWIAIWLKSWGNAKSAPD
jgi:predicted transcriptional regulator